MLLKNWWAERNPKSSRRRNADEAPKARAARKKSEPATESTPKPSVKKENKAASPSAPKRRTPRHANDEGDAPVVGLGDNVPAFFKIPLGKTAQK